MANFKILSMNCRGLADSQKRRDVFGFLRDKKCSIYCLQDTHFTKQEMKFIRAQWGYDIHISAGRRDARGVAILFNTNFEYKILKERADTQGNLLILEIEINKQLSISLITIYGPNQDSPVFFHDINEYIKNSTTDFTVLCGDFNLVLDPSKDYFNYRTTNNNAKSRNVVKDMIVENKLQDPFRVYNPLVSSYTWLKKIPENVHVWISFLFLRS